MKARVPTIADLYRQNQLRKARRERWSRVAVVILTMALTLIVFVTW